MKIVLKPNNTPTEEGSYLCLRLNSILKQPRLVRIRNSKVDDLTYLDGVSVFPLKDLNNEEVLWGDTIEIEHEDQ